MNREILFRGRTKEGEWVYGDLIHMDGKVYIGEPNSSAGKEVDPDTVGQFTGFTDVNGKDIYEGDILIVNIVKNGILCNEYKVRRVSDGTWMIGAYSLRTLSKRKKERDIKVVGNIYEKNSERGKQ